MLLDIMLPGMDGVAVCRTVREKGDIPILIMSARAEKDDKLNGFGLGADDYMEKPVDPDLLTAKVRALLQRTYGGQKGDGLSCIRRPYHRQKCAEGLPGRAGSGAECKRV